MNLRQRNAIITAWLSAIFFFLSLKTFSQDAFNKDSLERKIKLLIPDVTEKTPGYILAVISNGKVVYKTAQGSADLESNVPITENTIFNVGSVSKQFTAFLILQLEQEKKLSTEDLAGKYLSEYPVLVNHPIKISHLLHHTSGLRELLEIFELVDGQNKYGYTTENVNEILKSQQGVNFQPGEKHQYINTNYFLLGQIIEKVTGKTYSEYCKEKIFTPLHMSAAFVMDNFKKVIPYKAKAYIRKGSSFENDAPIDQFYGANGIHLNINDLALWIANFMTKQIGSEQLFNKFTSKGTLKGQPFSYGYGLYVYTYKGLPAVEHNGARHGYRAEVFYLPTKNFAVVALANYRSFPIANIPKVADYFLDIKNTVTTNLSPSVLIPQIKSGTPTDSSYAGVYWSPDADIVRKVYMNKKTLTYFRSTGNESRLAAAGDNLFYVTVGDSLTNNRLYFPTKDEINKWQMIFITAAGDSTFYKRVDTIDATTVRLNDYTGVFYCREIEGVLKLHVFNNDLLLKLKGWNEIILQPMFRDYYSNPEIGSFYFQRNDNNKIVSVVYDSPRTRHLVFKKIPGMP